MQEQRDIAALCQHLGELPRPLLVAIEGFMCSGKSFLANALGAELGGTVVHTDDFVGPGNQSLPYPQRIRYRLLATSLRSDPITLIEGICLRQVLARANAEATIFIYVKRLSSNGLWNDGFHLEDFQENAQSVLTEPGMSDLHYHATIRPHDLADIVFCRAET